MCPAVSAIKQSKVDQDHTQSRTCNQSHLKVSINVPLSPLVPLFLSFSLSTPLTGSYLKLWSEASPQVSGHQIWVIGKEGIRKAGAGEERTLSQGFDNSNSWGSVLPHLLGSVCPQMCVREGCDVVPERGKLCNEKSGEKPHSCLMFFSPTCIKRDWLNSCGSLLCAAIRALQHTQFCTDSVSAAFMNDNVND